MDDIDWTGTTDEALRSIAAGTEGRTRRAAKAELARREAIDPENVRRRQVEQRLGVATVALQEAQTALTQAVAMSAEDGKADVQAHLDTVTSALEELAPSTATDVALSEARELGNSGRLSNGQPAGQAEVASN